MPTRRIAKNDLKPYFDSVARKLGTRQVEIEVAALDLGDQVEADWTGLVNLSYDPKDDIIQISTGHLDHLIRSPERVDVVEGKSGLEAIHVVRGDGVEEIVRLRPALSLPAH